MLLKKQSLFEWGVQGVGRGHASLEPRLSYYNMFVAKIYCLFQESMWQSSLFVLVQYSLEMYVEGARGQQSSCRVQHVCRLCNTFADSAVHPY